MVLLNDIEFIESEIFCFEKIDGLIKLSNVSMDQSNLKNWLKIKLPEKLQKGETYFLKIGTFRTQSTPLQLLAGVSSANGISERKFYSRNVPIGFGKLGYSIEAKEDYDFLNLFFEDELLINELTIRLVTNKKRNNHIYKVVNGFTTEIEGYPGLSVKFLGQGSNIFIHEGSRFKNTNIYINDFSKVEIEKTNEEGINNTLINFGTISSNNELLIKKSCSIGASTFMIGNEHHLSVYVGEDNLWSSGIVIRASDGHQIFDNVTGRMVNRAKKIKIGNHVWIGADATVLKGACVEEGSVVGSNAVVTKVFQEKRVVIAGNPGKIIKRDISWARDQII